MYAMDEIKTEQIDDIDSSPGSHNFESQTNNLYDFQDDAKPSDIKQMESDTESENDLMSHDSLSNYSSDDIDDLMPSTSSDRSDDDDYLKHLSRYKIPYYYNWDAPEVQETIEQFKQEKAAQTGNTYKRLDELVEKLSLVMPEAPTLHTLRVYLCRRSDAKAFRQRHPLAWDKTGVKEAIEKWQNSEFYDMGVLSNELSEIMGKLVSVGTVRAHLKRHKLIPWDYVKKRKQYRAMNVVEYKPLYIWDTPEVQEIIEQFKKAGKTYKEADELIQNLSTVMPKAPSINTLRSYLCTRSDAEAFRRKPIYDWENARVKEAIKKFQNSEFYDLHALSAELSEIMGKNVSVATVRDRLVRFKQLPWDYEMKREDCQVERPLYNWDAPEVQEIIEQFKRDGKTYKQLDELVQNLSLVMPKAPSIHTLRVYLCRRIDGEAFRQRQIYDWDNTRVRKAIESFQKAKYHDLGELSAELSDIMGVIVPVATLRSHLVRFNCMPEHYRAKKNCKTEVNYKDPQVQLEIKQFFLRQAGYQPSYSQMADLKKRLIRLMPDKEIKQNALYAYILEPEVRNALDPYYKQKSHAMTGLGRPTQNAKKASQTLLKSAQKRKFLQSTSAQIIEKFDDYPSQSTEDSTSSRQLKHESDTFQEPFDGNPNNFVEENTSLPHRTISNISSKVPNHEHDYHLLSYWKCEASFLDKWSAENFCRRKSTSLAYGTLKHDVNKTLFECRVGNCNCAFYVIRNEKPRCFSVWSKEAHNHPIIFTEVMNHPKNMATKHSESQRNSSACNLDRLPTDNTFKTFADAIKHLQSSGMYSPNCLGKQMDSFKCGRASAGCPYVARIVAINVRNRITYNICNFGRHNHKIINEKDRERMKANRIQEDVTSSAMQEQNLPKRAKLSGIEVKPEVDNNDLPSGSGGGCFEIKPNIQQNSPAIVKPELISEHDETQSVTSASTLDASTVKACESQFSRRKYNWNTAGVHGAISNFQTNESSNLENLFEELATEFLQQTPTQSKPQKAGQNQKNTVVRKAKQDYNWNDPKVEEEIRKYYIDIGANNGLLSRHEIVMKRNELAERLICLVPNVNCYLYDRKLQAHLRKPEIHMRLDPYYPGYTGDLAEKSRTMEHKMKQ
ncbi:hypothetical protein Ddc_09927 [Ditylenchus destructor]|nr:hypothetical protein Ddc_09927 [Ditylenchus destructor]